MRSGFLRLGALAGLCLAAVLAAVAWFGAGREAEALEQAMAFCGTVRIGDDPEAVRARARTRGARESALRWVPRDDGRRTLDVVFSGAVPLSAHTCRIEAKATVTGTAYVRRR